MHARTDQKQKRGPFEYNNSYSNPTETDRKEGIEELLNTIDSFNPIFINWNFKLENPSKNKYKISRTTKTNLSNKQIHKRSLKKSPPQTILKHTNSFPFKKRQRRIPEYRKQEENLPHTNRQVNRQRIGAARNSHSRGRRRRIEDGGEKASSERFPVLMLVNLLINVSLTVPGCRQAAAWSHAGSHQRGISLSLSSRGERARERRAKRPKQEEARRRGRRAARRERAFSVRREISQPGRGPMPVNSVGRSLTR